MELEQLPSLPSSPPPLSPIEIELRLLEHAYAHLQIREPKAVARMVASLAHEQLEPAVMVVRREAGRYALIDGYEQVAALKRLGRDTVRAVVLELSEPEALSWCYRMQGRARRSALEEGWLVAELHAQGEPLEQIGLQLGRSKSWVSRRWGLSRALPEQVVAAVRRGGVPAHGAMRSLLPLARANKGHCERLCERLGQERVSSRQLAILYTAWRSADPERRERLVEAPLLFLKAKEAVTPPRPVGMAGELTRQLEGARTALIRAGDAVVQAWSIDRSVLSSGAVERAVGRCTEAYEALVRRMEEPNAE